MPSQITSIKLDVKHIISGIKTKYVKDYGSLDDRAYFMAGFVETVLNEINEALPDLKQRDYSKFYTPENVALRMVDLAEIKPGMKILEPSAGDGAIVRAIRRNYKLNTVHAVEINQKNIDHIKKAGADYVICRDFLSPDSVHGFYHVIIANPPFGNDTDVIGHVKKMKDVLLENGILVCILPKNILCKLLPDVHIDMLQGYQWKSEYAEIFDIENWAQNSDGTTTEICIVKYRNT